MGILKPCQMKIKRRYRSKMALSTRAKIKDQWRASKKAVENCRYHLMYIDKLSTDQSEYIATKLPAVIYATEILDDVLDAFRDGL